MKLSADDRISTTFLVVLIQYRGTSSYTDSGRLGQLCLCRLPQIDCTRRRAIR